jgi:hypothetical protein
MIESPWFRKCPDNKEGKHVRANVLTLNEVIERYRGQISDGTLRNWRSMRVGPSFLKIGKAVLYPLEELDRWDRRNLIVCRPFRPLLIDDVSK